ncbi:hypothetical protein A2526_01760 [candidate division WOR-1 bacterium RIFOXYD2_FULL_36_8]|uniref:Uncharacterized protein n=1 Tax=candidate division WOR-1 bacterium RIFOXYB2_FULL_36_35 TaxID=1802578 RepID=A0A1F4S3Z9_UNCSA|nr:MAG: hypothetical protein A2230_02940 [candidate division WOR-1 bacterium RIFOXYA2_FULL_36_21]OGC15139.1 MAG: hypothetical protein A2282_09000 [candidate division WOR-1 bacterium RIFOXYA12_FULL_36_13]OGC15161.1 MAG: hypothetical protein A2290_08850 [candidate division WOR-1 bacterium RIFOXYB2_FULL_36_35]OGC41832.1 MAG: hypothetical protein A2526_01760 [candidate division WOR-1 bacterium RIFOXYD2_FULL_36_8]
MFGRKIDYIGRMEQMELSGKFNYHRPTKKPISYQEPLTPGAKRTIKRLAVAAALAGWYAFSTPSSIPKIDDYVLPETISVSQAEFNTPGGDQIKITSPQIVKTSDIDLSSSFTIKTGRYSLIKEESSFLSSYLGKYIFSLPDKLYFWDLDLGAGLDAVQTGALLTTLESHKELKNLTARINHNAILEDTGRLFTDPQVKARNGFFSRMTLGLFSTLSGELYSELGRKDYYNSMTQTVVVFTNEPFAFSHELGHHIDHQRFSSDWPYVLASAYPPVTPYKEWRASKNALTLLQPKEEWQFYRFLMPALFAYIFAYYLFAKKTLKTEAQIKLDNINQKYLHIFRYFFKDNPFEIKAKHILRYMTTQTAKLGTGIFAYREIIGLMGNESAFSTTLGCLSFAVAFSMTGRITNKVLKKVAPYVHEQ